MASSLQRPQAIKEPFANSGDKNTIPVADTGTQRASLDEGFPQITEIPVSEGGIPPERKDMNALGYLTTSQYFYLQCGGRFTFDPDVSTAIGGYPAGAVLEYTDTNAGLSYAVISVINNNTYNFVATPSYIDGSKWKKAFSEDLSNYVNRTSNQTVGGQKTFTSNIIISRGGCRLYMDDTNYTQGTAPSSRVTYWVGFRDSAGTTTGGLSRQIETNFDSSTRVITNKQTSGSSAYASLQVAYTSDGKYQLAFSGTSTDTGDVNNSLSKTTSSTTDTYVPTMGWVNNPATSTNVVHRTGDETIGGIKTFTSQVTKTNNMAAADTIFVNKNKAITKGTAPSANVESRWRLTDSSTGDTNSALIGGVTFGYSTSMRTSAILQVGKPEASSTSTASLGIYYPATGNAYTQAPTPDSGDNSTKIATTEWVNSVLSTSGNGLAEFVLDDGTSTHKGYIKFKNGLIIQWGITSAAAANTNITLLTPFSNTYYSVTITSIGDTGVYQRLVSANTPKTTTGFTTYASGGAASDNFSWQAIGK